MVELIDQVNSVTTFLTRTTLLRLSTFPLGSEIFSPALLDASLSSDLWTSSTVGFPPLGNSDGVISVSIDFPLNSKEDAHFHLTASHYSRTDWDGLRDLLWDAPWEDIFKLGFSAVDSKFLEQVQFGTDFYIPHIYIRSKNTSFVGNNRINLVCLRSTSDRLVIVAKGFLRVLKLLIDNIKKSITSMNLGSPDFWWMARKWRKCSQQK